MQKTEIHVSNKDLLLLADELDKLKLIKKFLQYSMNAPKRRISDRFVSSAGRDLKAKVGIGMLTLSYRSRKTANQSMFRKKFWELHNSKENKALPDADPNKITLEKYAYTSKTTTMSYYNEDISLMLNRMGKMIIEVQNNNRDFFDYLKNDFAIGRDDEIFIKRKVMFDQFEEKEKEARERFEKAMRMEGVEFDNPMNIIIAGQFITRTSEGLKFKEKELTALVKERGGEVDDSYYNDSTAIYVLAPQGTKSGLAVAYEEMKLRGAALAEKSMMTIEKIAPPLMFAATFDDKKLPTAVERMVTEMRKNCTTSDLEI